MKLIKQHKALVFIFMFLLHVPLLADTNSSEICNKGSTSLYFSTVAENTKLFSSRAMSQGFILVPPDACVDIVPYGMNRVILTFFQKDNRGLLTNTTIVPKNATPAAGNVQYVCINPKQPYRAFASKSEIFSTFVNTTCPAGLSRAQPSWIHTPGGYNTYNIAVHANKSAVAWLDKDNNSYTTFPVLQQSAMQTDGKLVHVNPHAEGDHEKLKIMAGAVDDWLEKSKREADQRREIYWQKQQQKRAQHDARVKQAEQALTKPDDSVCDPFLDKFPFKRKDTPTLSGVRLQMKAEDAHKALVCNGFSINPQSIAKAGNISKYWSSRREKVYQKILQNGRLVFTDVETLSKQTATGRELVVFTVRIRYMYPELLNKAEWKQVKSEFKKNYAVGKLRGENELGIHRNFKYKGSGHMLQLKAHPYRKDEVRFYSITMM